MTGKTKPSKSEVLRIRDMAGRTEDRVMADVLADGLATSAFTTVRFGKADHGEVSLTDLVESMQAQATAVNAGDMAGLERMLVGQTVALNAIFGELARRAGLNMGQHLPAAEIYLKLALRAQAQSRATAETVAAIKAGPAIFARQANVAHGPQQVNNNAAAPPWGNRGAHQHAQARAGELRSQQNELSGLNHELRADTRTSCSAGGADPHLAPMGAVNRSNDA